MCGGAPPPPPVPSRPRGRSAWLYRLPAWSSDLMARRRASTACAFATSRSLGAHVNLSLLSSVLSHERSQDRVETFLNFGIRERAVRRLERQPHRQAHHIVGQTLALVAIEEPNRDERRTT